MGTYTNEELIGVSSSYFLIDLPSTLLIQSRISIILLVFDFKSKAYLYSYMLFCVV